MKTEKSLRGVPAEDSRVSFELFESWFPWSWLNSVSFLVLVRTLRRSRTWLAAVPLAFLVLAARRLPPRSVALVRQAPLADGFSPFAGLATVW